MTSTQGRTLSTSAEVPPLVPLGKSNLNGYDEFMSWRKSRNKNSFTEDVFMEFFREAAESLTPEALSTLFSTLKIEMRSKHKVNIGKFLLLYVFLRQKGVVITNCKTSGSSKGFSDEEINQFLTEAPDTKYLAMKAVAVIGIYADCQFTDLENIRLNMVNDYGTEIILRIPDGMANMSKVYSISGEFADIVRKYFQLRLKTPKITTDRFFLHYREGKCIAAAMGKVTIAKMARKIAEFLKLDHPENYTGHSLRLTSSKLVDKGLYADTTERSDGSSVTTSNRTGSVVTSTNVGMNNSTNSEECMRLYQDAEHHVLSDTSDAINLDDDESSQTYTVDSSSEDEQDVIEYVDQNGQDIISYNCPPTKQLHKRKSQMASDVEFVDLSSEPSGKEHHLGGIGGDIDSMSSNNVENEKLQSKIEEQAKEIARLKKLTDKQSLEIEILKELLEKSVKRSIRSEVS
ncbi:uncharacterized protein LOC119078227 [Bradysia coprophila]|uniref:uncharacterized protein LOC119078227 n=1 Tax=Bradysia coprophila TaxID=38358 RepID=UPI00187DAED3|nr:uncharacterized protein LOC119078227 [Bradysia coprophila]